jgi:DNA polymerase III delta prime subunit
VLSEKTRRQDFARYVLTNHLKNGRLAHTYLLTGQKESGKEDVALDFARALNCEKKNFFSDCDCLSCSKIFRDCHPDVFWSGKDKAQRSIKIEEVRELINAATLRPFEGNWKVFGIFAAEKMTGEAANAFLKTLEEPPAHTVFLLLVETKSYLLETIQSRAFEIRLKPLGDGETAGEERDWIHKMLLSYADWDDFLKGYHEKPREDLKAMLGGLSVYLADRLARVHGADLRPETALSSWLEAVDRVIETKEALDENANQKLALTRLAMRLGKMLPMEGVCR